MKHHQSGFNLILLIGTVFICGMIVLVLEVLGSRVLGPYFGISLFIWTSLITITLFSLSIGYWLGGILSDRYQSGELFYSLILGAAFSVMFIPMIQKPVSLAMTSLGPRLGCLATAFILFTLPLTLLGMVAPFSLKLSLREIHRAGTISGNLYALSTLGGILGTLSVGFWLIPRLGLRNILLTISIVLSILPGIYFFKSKKWLKGGVSLGIVIGSVFFMIYFSGKGLHEGIIYKSESYYGQLKVLEMEPYRYLMVNGVIQSGVQKELQRSDLAFLGTIEDVIQSYRSNLKKPHGLSGVVVGLGGGAIAEDEGKLGDSVDIVEIDPRMPDIAERFFYFHPDRFNIHLEDARSFFGSNQKKYQYIVLDVFSGESTPFYLLSDECFELVSKSLSDDGIVILNTVGTFSGEGSDYLKSIYKTLNRAFPYRAILTISARENFTNYIMIGSKHSLDSIIQSSQKLLIREVHLIDEQGTLLTDNYNPSDFLEQYSQLEWRSSIWKGMNPDILLD